MKPLNFYANLLCKYAHLWGESFHSCLQILKGISDPQMRAGERGEKRKWNTMVVLKLALRYQITNESLRWKQTPGLLEPSCFCSNITYAFSHKSCSNFFLYHSHHFSPINIITYFLSISMYHVVILSSVQPWLKIIKYTYMCTKHTCTITLKHTH